MKKFDDLPELKIDRSRIRVIENFDDSEEIEYWRNTSYEERLEHAYRLRLMAYGDKIRDRLSRTIEVVQR
jgi:hypothetical protein